MKDQSVSSIVGTKNLSKIKLNVFRYNKSLDDSSLLFWRPFRLQKILEWPYIFFLKLDSGTLMTNTDMG